MTNTYSPAKIASSLSDYWAPVVVAENDNTCIKVAKVKGELGWHVHDEEDKIFQVLKGVLTIQMETETVNLSEGEMLVVKKGIKNNPSAKEECHIMFIEPK